MDYRTGCPTDPVVMRIRRVSSLNGMLAAEVHSDKEIAR